MTASIAQSIADWWFFIALFVGVPFAVVAKARQKLRGWSRGKGETSAQRAVSMMATKDDTGAGFRRERREERRYG